MHVHAVVPRAPNATYSSWPGLTRPSTSFLSLQSKNVDARHKAGHDGWCFNASLHDRLILQRVDLLPVVPADRAGRGREIDHGEFLLRIDPPVGAAGAGPRKLSDRSHHPDYARRRAH